MSIFHVLLQRKESGTLLNDADCASLYSHSSFFVGVDVDKTTQRLTLAAFNAEPGYVAFHRWKGHQKMFLLCRRLRFAPVSPQTLKGFFYIWWS